MNVTVDNLDNLPLALLEEYNRKALEIANTVFNCVTQTQGQIYIIHGDLSDCAERIHYPIFQGKLETASSYVPEQKILHIYPENVNNSLILSGLKNNIVIIHEKINHLVIRKTNLSKIHIVQGTVSGVDILDCHDMIISMPNQNFTSLENSDKIYIYANMDHTSQLHVSGSLDVKMNDIIVPVNPFINAVFSQNNWNYKELPRLPDIMLLNQ